MGKQPAVLIIARHGARLDQADREWRDRADHPWDSPLSYGGWIHSQNLGARIMTELQNLDASNGGDAGTRGTAIHSRPRKRRKIIIHSSPYLRCVQTSIGIAAGLRYPQEVPRVRPAPTPFQRSSLSKPPMLADGTTSPPADKEADASPRTSATTLVRPDNGLIELKIDAWLGEWLSFGYFEKSSPPPLSKEMVQYAKASLKLPPEEIKGADLISPPVQELDEFDWSDRSGEGKDGRTRSATHEKTGLRAMAAKGHSMPRRTRTMSLNTSKDADGTTHAEHIGRRPRSTTYSPPVPTYSIASRDTIPVGFVAHARDNCIDTDFDWDSQRPPLEWGDGGQYGEEWSTMHRRFGKGLSGILSYYGMAKREDGALEDGNAADEEDEREEDGLVLILVTHQAGCNALIRLVTGAPALHDVGTTSLTLAVRRPVLSQVASAQSTTPQLSRRGSFDTGISDEFEMKIIASTEHLRSGSNPLGLNSPRLGMSPAFASRKMVGPDSLEGFSLGDPLTWRSVSQSNIPYSSSVRGDSSPGSSSVDGNKKSAGLWSMGDYRSGSVSSDSNTDTRYSSNTQSRADSTHVGSSTILEDEAIEDWSNSRHPLSHLVQSPVTVDDQTIWQPPSTTSPKVRLPIRSGSTRLSSNPTTGTGLWGSPVSNPGGVKEGTPHSRGSFGENDSAIPLWRSPRFKE